jgi:hypothetical protein
MWENSLWEPSSLRVICHIYHSSLFSFEIPGGLFDYVYILEKLKNITGRNVGSLLMFEIACLHTIELHSSWVESYWRRSKNRRAMKAAPSPNKI